MGLLKPTGIRRATPNPKAAITNIPVLLKATAATELNLRFPGQYEDAETGTFYNYQRQYLASQGRYTQGDPIGVEGGLNRFGYVGARALVASDPEGLRWIYQQSTGNLYRQDNNPSATVLVGSGYSGAPGAVNNGLLDSIGSKGPIPTGDFLIGPQQTITTSDGRVLPGAMRLYPEPGSWLYGRDGFIIHGGDMVRRTSSAGCIIQVHSVRDAVGIAGDRRLAVVP